VNNDEGTALRYADVYTNLEKQGVIIPINDIWVAAFAIRHELPLLAKDEHFSRIAELNLISL
jgi:predicted nucleic acid-binding protein